MSSFSDAWTEIEAACSGRLSSSSASADTTPDAFSDLIRLALGTSADVKRSNRAVEVLRESGQLTPAELAASDLRDLEQTLKAAGVSIGPKGLRAAVRVAALVASFGADAEEVLREKPLESLRDDLLSLNGIGSATADEMLLFALGRPTYPVDRATYRILARHGWLDPGADYEMVRDQMTSALGGSAESIVRATKLLGWIGREFCKAGVPKCEKCPMKPWLPDGGPIDQC